MKKVLSLLLFITFIFSLSGPSFSAVKKAPVKKTKIKVKVTKKKVKVKVKATAARPVFPVDKGSKKIVVTREIKVIAAPKPALKPEPRARIFAEGGYGAGGLVVEAGYGGLELMKKLNFSVAAGLGMGSGYSVVVLDLARVTYEMDKFYAGGGINYAVYSSPNVQDVPGISGRIPNQNMFGVELLGGMRVRDNIFLKTGFSTALGIRASIGYEF